MISSRRTITISATRDPALYGGTLKKRGGKGKKILLFLFAPFLILFFLFLTNENFSQGLKFRLNELELRYDTFSISFSNTVPTELGQEIESRLIDIEHNGKKRFVFVEDASDIEIGLVEEEYAIFTDHLIPVGHFYWLKNSLESEKIYDKEIVVSEENYDLVRSVLEKHFDSELSIVKVDDVLSYLEENEDSSISFLTLEDLDFKYQILYFDDKYFLDDFDGGIAFYTGIKINAAPEFLVNIIKESTQDIYESTHFDEILKVNMSGVTAISRNLAFEIEASGNPAYPAEYIADFLGDADLVHTSNEVSFVPGCKPERSMRFCSHPSYIETLDAINANVIELTGNHNNDFGSEYNTQTIEMYKERGWGYYGGGLNTEDAQEILFEEVKDSKIAFIGYNYYDSIHNFHANLAGENRAGANSFSFEKMKNDIKQANEQDALTIVTFQFEECWSYPPNDVIYPPCYKPLSNPDQRQVFRTAIDYGADIVIGSQAHQPQTYEIYDGKPIFYGTGNLFFDQIYWIGTRQGMILSHYIHDGRLLQSKITTTLYDDDMRPYVTTGEDRDLLLRLLREARD